MNSRERVLTALNHEEPDRVPIDLGGSAVTTISIVTCADLRRHLGLAERPVRILETVQQVACVDDDLMDALGVDVIPVLANDPSGYTPVFKIATDGSTTFKDEFGATLLRPNDGFYYDWRGFPLPEPSLGALATMAWPNPADPARYKGLRERVKQLRANTNRALFSAAPCGHDLLNQLFRVRGMEEGMMDLLINEEFAEAFLDRLTNSIITAQEHFLDEVGDLVDVHFAADDLCGQTGPLISPEVYRRMIKPRWARIIKAIKSKTKAKIFYHGCGAVEEFIPDLIEIGVDILNPVQVNAAGMDLANLKKKYGKNLSFWGGGCDTQKVLPRGTVQEVRAEVKQRIRELAPGGGFVFNPVHNIQPLVPIENVAAMFETVKQFGVYPIEGKQN